LLRLARLTGCRPGELCDLRWSDLSADRALILLPPDRHKTGHQTAEARRIFIPTRARRLIRFLESLPRRPDGRVFGRGSKPWTIVAIASWMTIWRRWLHDTGLPPITSYDLRHAYCTEAIANGASYADVAKLVGNSPATLARYYDHPVIERLASVADQIAEKRLRRMIPGNQST
jgi:integrase